MNFDVHWSAEAEQELAALWLDPALRAQVTAASQVIDRRLERNGPDEGESRAGRRRITFEPPLGVTFLVDEQSRTITVTHVWAYST